MPRSVIPGRQRWDIPILWKRQRVAYLLELELGECPGITMVQASSTTGRLLIVHDDSVSGDTISGLVGAAATSVAVNLRQTSPALPGAHEIHGKIGGSGL